MRCQILFASLVLVLSLAGSVSAQGALIGDDGFNVGCCNTPNPNLPVIPNLPCTAKWACFTDCSLTTEHDMILGLTHTPILCDQAFIDIAAGPAPGSPGAPSFTITTLAKYSRTWREPGTSIADPPRQVWRFLINGDATFTGLIGVGTACPVPTCAIAGHPVHLTGHVDYAVQNGPSGPVWWVAVSLVHHKGCISHAPWSALPLTGIASHDRQDYFLVGPGAFAFGPVPEPTGPIIAEAVRPSIFDWSPFNYQCLGEARVVNGFCSTLNDLCLGCGIGSPTPPTPWKDQSLGGQAFCTSLTPSTFATVPVPGLTAGGLLCYTVGAWAMPPGTWPKAGTHLYHYFGVMDYDEPCTGRGPIHVVTGVATQTQTARQLFAPPGQAPVNARTMLDLRNNLVLPLFPGAILPVPYPGWGRLSAADLVFNLNFL